MDYKKKLKTRLYIAVIYTVLGIMMIAGGLAHNTDNAFITSFGFALTAVGIVRIVNYFVITKNEETIRKQKIAENDERNISISNRARSAAFAAYILFSCIAVVVLSLLNRHEAAQMIEYSVCFIVVIYWISYLIIRKRS